MRGQRKALFPVVPAGGKEEKQIRQRNGTGERPANDRPRAGGKAILYKKARCKNTCCGSQRGSNGGNTGVIMAAAVNLFGPALRVEMCQIRPEGGFFDARRGKAGLKLFRRLRPEAALRRGEPRSPSPRKAQ